MSAVPPLLASGHIVAMPSVGLVNTFTSNDSELLYSEQRWI
ncbi:MAG: hypothetical protein AB1589_28305 [Cyanobacteriota bacterium]